MSDNLHFFRGYSLVDITATGVTRSLDPDDLARNQQRNWETVLQCMGLRTQPLHVTVPQNWTTELELHEFGSMYSGQHEIWSWTWAVEREGVYDFDNEPMGALKKDFEQVPVVTYLTETARFMLPIFYPHGSIRNIYFAPVK